MVSSKVAALTLKVEESSTKERRVGLAALVTLRLSARSSSVGGDEGSDGIGRLGGLPAAGGINS